MSERASRRKGGGRAGRREARGQSATTAAPFIERNIPYVEILSEENLQLIEHNADRLLAEIGIDFLDDPEVLDLFKEAGADIDGTCLHHHRLRRRSVWDGPVSDQHGLQNSRGRSVVDGNRERVLASAFG